MVHFTEPAYRQHFEGFEPGISALDIVCNYGPEASGIIAGGVIR
ncbi:MAG: WbqC family protein [Rhodothermales bacterium]